MTEIIARPRGAGKTYETFQRMNRDESLIYVAPTYAHAGAAFKMAQGLGFTFDPKRFMSAQAAISDRQGGVGSVELAKRHYVIDNAELVLASIFGNVDVITIGLKIEAG
jgi:hypothetical protein